MIQSSIQVKGVHGLVQYYESRGKQNLPSKLDSHLEEFEILLRSGSQFMFIILDGWVVKSLENL